MRPATMLQYPFTAPTWHAAPRLALPFALACLLGGGCATLPRDPVERGLYVDLRKAVQLNEDAGWVVDRAQLDSVREDTMRSVCQVAPAQRLSLETWLDGQIAVEGGPAEVQYKANGGDLDALDEVLSLERTRMLLRYGDDNASVDCPFWLEIDEGFRGVQGDADRWLLLFESSGFGAIIVEGDDVDLGGGGSGRLLVGRGFGSRLTLALGAGLGGTGAFVENAMGNRSIDTAFSATLPLLLRVHEFSRVFDLEVAPVVRFGTTEDNLPPGLRTAIGAGLTTLRASAFMPYIVLWVGYEYHPPRNNTPADHSVRVGTRVGVDWDP